MLFISMQRSRWRCWYLWGWRPKEPKIQIRLRPWDFFQETSVCFGCQMSFPPFALREWIRIVDSFQIFLPELLGLFSASLRIDFSWCRRASPNRCILIGNASSGGQQPLWPSWCLGKSEPRLDTFFQVINRPIQVHSILKSKSCPCLYRAEDLRMISGANTWKVNVPIWFCYFMLLSWRKQAEIRGKKMVKMENMPLKRRRPKGNDILSQTPIELCSPKHKSQMFQLILNSFDKWRCSQTVHWVHDL